MNRGFWVLFFVLINVLAFGQNAKYASDQLFLKVKDDFNKELPLFDERKAFYAPEPISDKEISKVMEVFNIYKVLANKKTSRLPSVKLNKIYTIRVKDSARIANLILELSKLPFIDYVERVPMYSTEYTPNDLSPNQWNLTKTKIPQAWDLSRGVSTVVIAIVDDAVRLNHEDLAANIWINPKEIPNNGIDDDSNGYIDDINGYDVADNDNNPTTPSTATNSEFTHGTHCAGIASARTDNSRGIASPGFSCKIMAVKTKQNADNGPTLPYAYNGLEYAISSGAANVISLSWGGYGKSNTFQLLIDYAYSKGIVIVAAAGNSNTNTPFYPASYNHVISVGATDINDQRAFFSNYGATIDIMAPGLNIWSTLAGSTSSYGFLSGTSMACPLVSGICGLMLSYAPGSSPDFIESCLKSNADNIDGLNSGYVGQLGAGRVNAQSALACLRGIPVADFLATTTSICVGQSVTFYDKSLGNAINAWNWTFSGTNINRSTSKNPTVTYLSAGTYPVSLTVTNNGGSNTITKQRYITVYQPTASISGSATISAGQSTPLRFDFSGNIPYNVAFSDGLTISSLSGINSSPYFAYVSPTATKTYTISSFSDGSCAGNKSGSAVIAVSTVTAPCQNCTTVSGLIASYPFCGNANDVSGNNYNGTVTGATLTTDRFGNANGAYYFDGTNGCYINTNFNGILGTNPRSISAWVKLGSTKEMYAFGWGSRNLPYGSSYSGGFSYGSALSIISEGNDVVKGFGNTDLNNWHHIVWVAGSNATFNQTQIYYDGVLLTTTSVNYNTFRQLNTVQDVTLKIGANALVGSNINFQGSIDDVKIYDKVLSQSEVTALYYEPAPCTSTGLVASYPFCGNANDVSGNNLNATVSGATLTTDRFGNANSAYSFNGINNFIEVQDASQLRPSTISISFWAKTSQMALYQIIYKGKWQDASSEAYSINYSQGSLKNYPTFAIKSGSNCVGGNGWKIASNNANLIDINNWNHVVATYDGAIQKIYLNSILVATNTFSGTIDNCVGSTLNFGRSWSTYPYYFKGELDDIKIYNKALSVTQIQNLYNEPAPCTTTKINSNCTKALEFTQPSSGQHVALGTGFNVPNTFSVQSWVKLRSTSSTGFYYIVSKHVSATYLGSYALFVSNKIATIYVTGVGNVAFTTDATIPLDDNWHHLAGTYDGSVLKLYIDGALNNSTNIVRNVNQSSVVRVLLGACDFGNGTNSTSLDGIIDDAAIFNKTLSQTEIQNYMNAGVPSTASGLLGNWKFEENDPIICTNSVLGSANGTISGNAIRTYDTPNGTAGINCGIVASYPFCGNASDVSGNNYTGTVTGASLASDRFGNTNSAYFFNGSNYIRTSFPGISGTKARTLNFWVKPSLGQQNSYQYLGSYGLFQNGGYDIRCGINFNQAGQASLDISDGAIAKQTNNLYDGNWHMVTYAIPSNTVLTGVKIYLDGNLLTVTSGVCCSGSESSLKINTITTAVTSSSTNLYNFNIGVLFTGNSNSPTLYSYYYGYLDDISVYNYELSQTQIKSLLNAPAPCLTDSLVLYYPFCKNPNDQTKFANNGTSSGANLTADRFGIPQSAYNFNGTNAFIESPLSTSLGIGNAGTISLWARRSNWSNLPTVDKEFINNNYAYPNANNMYLSFHYGQGIHFRFKNGGFDFVSSNIHTTWQNNSWHHIVGKWEPNGTNTGISLYADGVLLATKTISGTINVGSAKWNLGKYLTATHQEWFDGDLDDIRIYNKAITGTTISSLYNESAPCITCLVTVTPAIVGNTSICNGGIENYSISSIAGITYIWSITGSNFIKQNGNQATVTWTGQGIFTLSGIPSSTCVGISKLTVTVGCCTLTPVKANFVVNTNSCTGQTFSVTNASINTSLTSTYLWSFGPDGVPSQTTVTSPAFVYFRTPGQKIITLRVNGTGCKQSDTKSDTIFFYPVPVANAGPDIYLCTTLGQSLGASRISDNRYVWHPGTYVSDSTIAQPTLSTFYNGPLVLEVRYGESNCVGYDTLQVYKYPAVSQDKFAICKGEVVVLKAANWNTKGLYSWKPSSYIYQDLGVTIVVNPDKDTTFTLSINSISGCGIATAKIQVEQPYTLKTEYSPIKYCINDTLTLKVTNSRPTFEYTWLKYTDSTVSKNGASVKFVYPKPTIQPKVVENSLCKNEVILPIKGLDSTFVNTHTPVVESICIEPTLTISSSLAKNRYIWSNGATSNSTQAVSSGLYWVKTYNFCEEHVDSFYVTIRNVENYFPNIFSPNDDQKNDFLVFQGCAFQLGDVSLEVFNRSGEIVYSTKAYKQDWTAKGVPSGMYFYILKNANNDELTKGWLQIVK